MTLSLHSARLPATIVAHLLVLAACTEGPAVSRSPDAVRSFDPATASRPEPTPASPAIIHDVKPTTDGAVLVAVANFRAPLQFVALTLAPLGVAPLTVEEAGETIRDVATQGDTLFILTAGRTGTALWRRDASGTAKVPVPSEAPAGCAGCRLVADATDLALIEPSGTVFVRHGSSWRAVASGRSPPGYGFGSVLLHGSHLYVAWSLGEFGGGLEDLDLSTGHWTDLVPKSGRALPVTGLAVASDGELLVAEGLAHLTFIQGRVRAWNGRSWTVWAGSSNIEPAVAHKLEQRGAEGSLYVQPTRWPWPPSAFDGLTLDGGGRPIVSSASTGVSRFDGSRWVRVTPTWHRNLYLGGLAVVDEKAILGTDQHGVLVVDLETGAVSELPVSVP